MQEKGKRKNSNSLKGEQSYNMKVDPILMKVALEVEAKRKQMIQRAEWRKREKHSLEEAELKLQEKEQKRKEEQEFRSREQEEKKKK